MGWHGVIPGLVGAGLATWLLNRAASKRSKPSIDRDGWHSLKANGTMRVTLAVSIAVAILCAVILATGYYRTEERGETIALALLIAGFAIGAAVLWWQGFARKVCWRGDVLRTSRFGTVRDYSFSSLSAIEIIDSRWEFRLHFAEGAVPVSMLSTGLSSLLERLSKLYPDLFPDIDE